MRLVASTASLVAILACPVHAVQINEIRIDQPGTDDDEYLELFGPPGALLDGLTYVVIGDGTKGSGEIEFALDLTGNAIPLDGFFLVAEDSDTFGAGADLIATLNFENSDNVTHLLLNGFSGTVTDDLDSDDDGILDVTPWTGIVDGLALVEDAALPPMATERHYGAVLGLPVIGPDGSFVPGHVFRLPDGGALRVGAFDPVVGMDSPGATNIPEPNSIGLICLGASVAVILAACTSSHRALCAPFALRVHT